MEHERDGSYARLYLTRLRYRRLHSGGLLPRQRLPFRRICCVCDGLNKELLRNYLFIFLDFLLYRAAADTAPSLPPPTLLLLLLFSSLTVSLSRSLSPSPPPYRFSSLSLAKGEQKRWFLHHPSSLASSLAHFFFFFKSPSPFLFFSSSLLDEMIRFPTEACCVFCCGGGALFSVGRLSCPQALPVGDGDSPQNSCHMKLRPATSHA